ncbi:MAG: site-specific tyrosine recombinase XerD [Alphaproteobacteria bacterium]
MDNAVLIESFLEMIIAEGGASANTVAAYKNDLISLSLCLEEKGSDLKNAKEKDLRDFLAQLSKNGFAKKSQSRKISALKMFYRFLFTEEIIKINPSENLDSPKTGKSLPKYLSEDEIKLLIKAAGMIKGKRGLKIKALIELLYSTGLRVSELVGLPISAVARNPEFIIVRGKGSKERLVPLSTYAKDAVNAWLQTRSEQKGKKIISKWLFPSDSKLGHLTRDGFFKIMKELALNAGINPERVSPHVIRHSFASHLVAHDADLRTVQKMLGHSDIATTEIYTHLLDEKLTSIVSNFHPLSRK